MLGLLKGTVQLSEYQENWKMIFEATKEKLRSVIGNQVLDIQHIGSTSIKNIPAKPILDIAILLEDISKLEDLQKPLENLGYVYRGDKGDRGGQLFVLESSPGVRTQHVHIVDIHDPQWKKWLAFRNHLNAHPEEAEIYGSIKRKLAEKHADNRLAYTASKDDFVTKLLTKMEEV